MIDISQQPSSPAQSPLPGNGHASPLVQVPTGRHGPWMALDHRSPHRHPLYGRGMHLELSNTHESSWLYGDSTASEDLGEDEHADFYPTHPQLLENEEFSTGSHSPHVPIQDPSLFNHETLFTPSLDPPRLNETLSIPVPRQPHSASTGRERKRLAKPSLVVKLKTPTQGSGRRDPHPSGESSSAAQIAQNSHPFDLRTQGSVALSSANTRTRGGWEPHAGRRLTRRAEAIQSSQRKRRRDAVSPQDGGIEGTTTPSAGLPQGK